MQLRNKTTVARNVRIHRLSLLNAKHKTHLFSVRGRERNVKNNTQTTGKAIQFLLRDIRFVSERLELLEHTELKRVQVKTSVSFAWSSRKNVALPSFSRGSLFSTCLDCFLIFVLTCNECVTVFIQCFSPILLRFILSCFDISEWKAFLIWWNLPFCTVKILMIDTTTRN